MEFSCHFSETSRLEAAFARGDRRLSEVLISAYENGARLDSWDEHFNKPAWEAAFEANGLTVEQFANRRIGIGAPLAWEHMDAVVSQKYLKLEHERAYEGTVTRDCRKGCNGCFGSRCSEFCGKGAGNE